MLAADTMEALGIPRGSYVVKVNNRKVLDGVMEAIGLGGEENAGKRLGVLRAIDKLDRLGRSGVEALLGKGRKDESGDFTRGAELNDSQVSSLMSFIIAAGSISDEMQKGVYLPKNFNAAADQDYYVIDELKSSFYESRLAVTGLDELETIRGLVRSAGYETERIRIDPSVVRGLEYYTGPVYEVELTFPIAGEDGKPVRFGSVGGGGRYDGLVGRFRSEPVPATGFSIGVSRLLAALQAQKSPLVAADGAFGPVIVTVFDQDRVADYQRMVARLRAENIRAELYLGGGKFGPQMKYADKRRAPCVVIQGSDEKNHASGPQVVVKDLFIGADLAKLEKGRAEHLQKQAEAQRMVPEDELVAAVRAVLARHQVRWE
jgi:histidyl-tRNA synthetase